MRLDRRRERFICDPNGSQFEPILAELEQLRLFYEEEIREEDDV